MRRLERRSPHPSVTMRAILALAALLVTVPASGGDPPPDQAATEPSPAPVAPAIASVEVPRVVPGSDSLVAYVSVQDVQGDPVAGVSPAAFSVTSASLQAIGTQLGVGDARQLSSTGEGIAVAMLVDTSCSMDQAMWRVRNAARQFVTESSPEDVFTIVSFADEVGGLDAGWTSDRSALADRISALEVPPRNRNTVLYEALGRSLQAVAQQPDLPPMRALLVLGDGIDEGSKDPYSSDYVQSLSARTGLPIFTVWFQPGSKAAEGNGLETFRALSSASNADTVEAVGQGEGQQDPILLAFQRFQATAHGVYRLQLTGQGSIPAGEYAATMTVTVGDRPVQRAFRFEVPSSGIAFPAPAAPVDEPAEDTEKSYVGWIVLGVGLVVVICIGVFLVAWSRPKRIPRDDLAPDLSGLGGAGPAVTGAPQRGPTLLETSGGPGVPVIPPPGTLGPGMDFGQHGGAQRPPIPPSPPAAAAPPARRRNKTVVMDGSSWWLDVIEGADEGKHFIVHPGTRLVVGAEGDCDIVLTDGTVSSHHAEIEAADDGLLVADQRSTNGTFLDGSRQQSEFLVRPGNVLSLGRCRLVVRPAER